MTRPDILASVYGLILAWPDNENAPDDAANEDQGQLGKDNQISFRSLPIITPCRGEELSNINHTE